MKAASETARTTHKAGVEPFSDRVFAFAITLLVRGFQVPELRVADEPSLRNAVLKQFPQATPCVTSFATIGVIWKNHHPMFHELHHVERGALTRPSGNTRPSELLRKGVRNSGAGGVRRREQHRRQKICIASARKPPTTSEQKCCTRGQVTGKQALQSGTGNFTARGLQLRVSGKDRRKN